MCRLWCGDGSLAHHEERQPHPPGFCGQGLEIQAEPPQLASGQLRRILSCVCPLSTSLLVSSVAQPHRTALAYHSLAVLAAAPPSLSFLRQRRLSPRAPSLSSPVPTYLPPLALPALRFPAPLPA